MKSKTLVLLLILFVIISVFAGLIIRHKGLENKRRSVGVRIFSDIPLEKIWEIDIKKVEENVTLRKKDGAWRVKEYYDYLADFSQISELMDKLKGLTTGEEFKADKPLLKRLILMDPEDPKAKDSEKGTALILKDKEGRIIKKIIFGKAMRQSEQGGFPAGQYIRLANKDTVYLVNQYLTILTQGPKEWIRLEVVNVRPLDIKRIIGYKKGKIVYVLEKEKETEKEFHLKKGPKEVKDKIRRIKDGINYLTIEGIVDPKQVIDLNKFGISEQNYIQYELFSGMIYKVYPGGKCGKESCYIKIAVSYNGKDKELLNNADKQNRLLSCWVFKVSKWRHDSFFLP